MNKENKKKVFLVISGNSERLDQISVMLNEHYEKPVIYSAPSGNVGLLKLKNAEVDIVVIDSEQHTPDSLETVESILLQHLSPHAAIIIVGHPPEEEKFVDEIVTGKISFIEEELNNLEFNQHLVRGLNYNSHRGEANFYLRFLAAGDVLINEGEVADFVYILKSGQLRAYNMHEDKKIILGEIEAGEFVGEMAYINHERRTASIEALTDAQLIEVPIGLIDKILYKRPSWTRALIQTLSKRLKNVNKELEKA